MDEPSDAVDLARAIGAVARERQVTVLAAGVAYYAFNASLPLVVLVTLWVSAIGSPGPLLGTLETWAGVDAGQVHSLLAEHANTGAQVKAGLIALGILLWSALRMFRALDRAFASVYGTRGQLTPVGIAVDALLALATIAIAIALVGGVGVALALLLEGWLWSIASSLLLFAALVATFVPMYYVFPEPEMSIRDALPGATFAAVLWAVSGVFFRGYAATSEGVQLYGVIGAVLLVLTWFYVGGLVLLVGVVVNAVLSDAVDPDERWLPEWAQ